MTLGTYHDFVMAMDRNEQRLKRSTAALGAAGVPYAVVGGNAVASWVARVDPGAVRTTHDVDLTVRRADEPRVSGVMADLGYERQDLRRLVMFTDPQEPSRRTGIHLVWAGEKVRPSYPHPTPEVDESEASPEGFRVLKLAALLRMKLTSFRDIDRVHVTDLHKVGLIDDAARAALPLDLLPRLDDVLERFDDELDG